MSGPVQFLSVLVAAFSNAAYALMVGVLLASRWLEATAAGDAAFSAKVAPTRSLKRVGLACMAVLLLCHIVRPWFVAASMSGSSGFKQVLVAVPDVLLATRQGALWYANWAILAVLLAAVLLISRGTKSSLVWLTALFCLCLFSATKAASGHAAGGGDFTLTEICQFLHLLATAVWAGAVVVSGFLVAPRLVRVAQPARLWNYGGQLSTAVTWGLAVLLITGVYTSDRELNGSLSALWTSGWGRVLIAKVVLVLIAMLLGALNRFKLKRDATAGNAASLAAVLRTEAGLMVLILVMSAVLASTPPAMSG